MPETKVRSGQLVATLSSKTIDSTNTINTDLTKLAIAGGTAGQVLSTNGSGVLSFITASGGGAQVQVDTYTSSGTWTKPAWGKYFKVFLISGGGGAGSGARRATTSARGGGGGGAGSGILLAEFTATQVTGNQSITIGAGGTGGASVTADNTNGNNGTAGGASSFGSLMTQWTPNFGEGGTTSGGNRGQGFATSTVFGRISPGGGGQGGGTSSPGTVAPSSNADNDLTGAGGGAGGAGATANVTTTQAGGTISIWSNLLPSVANSSGGTNGGSGNNGVSFTWGYVTTGTQGGGGSYKTAQATGAGGNGSYGSGGGGGAASDNGHASGAGGNGGNGICIVVSIG